MRIFSVRFYKDGKVVKEILAENLNKELKRKLKLPKKKNKKIENIKNYDDVRVICYSQVKRTGIKKTPDLSEIGLGGSIEEKIGFVKENLGKDIPIHLIRFFPSYKMLNVKETPVKTLEKLASVAKEIGMEYVYIGNVFGHELENTYCPNCGSLVVKREGFFVESMAKEGRCPKCGLKIKGVMRNIFS